MPVLAKQKISDYINTYLEHKSTHLGESKASIVRSVLFDAAYKYKAEREINPIEASNEVV